VIFGAGKIGRSFIGQLFSLNGYQLVFVDKNRLITDELNRRDEYHVVVKAEKDCMLVIKNFSGIYADDKVAIAKVLGKADLAATCVGKNAFEEVISLIGECLTLAVSNGRNHPLDIILGENIINAAQIAKKVLSEKTGNPSLAENLTGLVETSIGKMVPILARELEVKDPLMVYAEPYNTLILDKKAFKNQAPEFPGIQLVNDIEAWVYRKALIHNLGHAALVYAGYFHYPASLYVSELVDKPDVFQFAKNVMRVSAGILHHAFPDEFNLTDLTVHTDELLLRFANKALGDTLFRVGSGLYRKFGPDDRIFGAVTLAEKHGINFLPFLETAAYGLFFRAVDENGNYLPEDGSAIGEIETDPMIFLTKATGYPAESPLLQRISELYSMLKNKKADMGKLP